MPVDYAQRCVELLPKLTEEQRREILEAIEELLEDADLMPQHHDRAEVVRRTCGILADLPISSDDYAREKQMEIEREELKWAR